MSLLTRAIRRRAFEKGSGDTLFRREVVHQGSLWGCSVCPLGRNPSNCAQMSELKNLLKDREKKGPKGPRFE